MPGDGAMDQGALQLLRERRAEIQKLQQEDLRANVFSRVRLDFFAQAHIFIQRHCAQKHSNYDQGM